MDRTAFEHLYLHANSIAELGFRRAVSRVLLAPPQAPTAEQAAAYGELNQILTNPSEADFDWSAFDGIEGFGPSPADGDSSAPISVDPVNNSEFAAAPHEQGLTDGPAFSDAIGELDSDPDDDGPPDIARYLANVETARVRLQPRVDSCFARADHAAINAALATLPRTLPAITAPLSPDDFTRWLEVYEARHEGLEAVVMEIRKLEPLI